MLSLTKTLVALLLSVIGPHSARGSLFCTSPDHARWNTGAPIPLCISTRDFALGSDVHRKVRNIIDVAQHSMIAQLQQICQPETTFQFEIIDNCATWQRPPTITDWIEVVSTRGPTMPSGSSSSSLPSSLPVICDATVGRIVTAPGPQYMTLLCNPRPANQVNNECCEWTEDNILVVQALMLKALKFLPETSRAQLANELRPSVIPEVRSAQPQAAPSCHSTPYEIINNGGGKVAQEAGPIDCLSATIIPWTKNTPVGISNAYANQAPSCAGQQPGRNRGLLSANDASMLIAMHMFDGPPSRCGRSSPTAIKQRCSTWRNNNPPPQLRLPTSTTAGPSTVSSTSAGISTASTQNTGSSSSTVKPVVFTALSPPSTVAASSSAAGSPVSAPTVASTTKAAGTSSLPSISSTSAAGSSPITSSTAAGSATTPTASSTTKAPGTSPPSISSTPAAGASFTAGGSTSAGSAATQAVALSTTKATGSSPAPSVSSTIAAATGLTSSAPAVSTAVPVTASTGRASSAYSTLSSSKSSPQPTASSPAGPDAQSSTISTTRPASASSTLSSLAAKPSTGGSTTPGTTVSTTPFIVSPKARAESMFYSTGKFIGGTVRKTAQFVGRHVKNVALFICFFC